MKKLMKLFSLSTITLVLVGCGGGGGGGSESSSPKPVNHTNTIKQPTSEVKADDTHTTEISTPKEAKVKGAYIIGADRDNVGFTSFSLSGDKLDVLDAFPSSIPLVDPAYILKDGWYKIGNGVVNSSELLQYVRHGAVEDKRGVYIFAQGEKAENIPTSGKFTYKGHATLVSVLDKEDKGLQVVYGLDSTFDVDFDKKSLIGSIGGSPEGKNIVFDADIKGDKFSKWGGLSGVSVDGAFYGKDASELGGTYLLRDVASGTFGAKRQ